MRSVVRRRARGVIQISIAEVGSLPATMHVELDERGGNVEARAGSIIFLVHVPRFRASSRFEMCSTMH